MRSFSETQRFTQKWVWAILIIAALLPAIISCVQWLISGKKDASLIQGMAVSVLVGAIFMLLFRSFKLMTTIDETGISYQFFPLHTRPIKKGWNEFERVYIKQYSPLRDFGGWGIRYSMSRDKGMAYNIAGNMGVQLVFKGGRKILLGTQHPDEIAGVLEELKSTGKISIDIHAETI